MTILDDRMYIRCFGSAAWDVINKPAVVLAVEVTEKKNKYYQSLFEDGEIRKIPSDHCEVITSLEFRKIFRFKQEVFCKILESLVDYVAQGNEAKDWEESDNRKEHIYITLSYMQEFLENGSIKQLCKTI